MPDISMCYDDGETKCPMSDTCYRFLAKPDRYQTYGFFKPICKKENYRYYWPIERTENAIRMRKSDD